MRRHSSGWLTLSTPGLFRLPVLGWVIIVCFGGILGSNAQEVSAPEKDAARTETTAVTVGMEGRLMETIPGGLLEALPVGEKTPIIMRIHDVLPHGTDHRYDLRYFGRVPGEYNLAQFLRLEDGSAPQNLKPIPVRIRGLLPEDHNGHLLEPASSILPLPGGYRAWMTALALLWALAVIPLVLAGRKKKTALADTGEGGPPDLAERMRPLVEQAASGALDTAGRARLERMIFSHWREQLDLPKESELARMHQQLKDHEEAGPLLRGLEDWLHRPPGTATVDIAALLAPYHHSSNRSDQ